MNRLKRPMLRCWLLCDGRICFVGPYGALIDPRTEQRDLITRKRLPFAFGGHPLVLADARHAQHERALDTVILDDRRSVVAAGKGSLSQVKTEAGFLLFRSVTGVAVLGE